MINQKLKNIKKFEQLKDEQNYKNLLNHDIKMLWKIIEWGNEKKTFCNILISKTTKPIKNFYKFHF